MWSSSPILEIKMQLSHDIDDLRIRAMDMRDRELIWLYLGPMTRQRAQIIGRTVLLDRDTEPGPGLRLKARVSITECPGLPALEDAVGRTFDRVCVVVNAVILHSELLGQGHGVRLYASLARVAGRNHDAPIVSSPSWSGGPSPTARRVWESQRLAQDLTVHDLCAWGGVQPCQ